MINALGSAAKYGIAWSIVLCVAGCTSQSPVAPSAAASQGSPNWVFGDWLGKFDVSPCGSRACSGGPESFSLRVSQTPNFTSVMGLTPDRTAVYLEGRHYFIDMTGVAQPDGSIVFVGTSVYPKVDVQLTVTADAQHGLAGMVTYTHEGSGGAMETRRGPILYASRERTIVPGLLHGTWAGYLRTAQCSGDCKDIYGLAGMAVLKLAQSGTSIIGDLSIGGGSDELQLEGIADGATATLHGGVAVPDCVPFYEGRVCNWTIENFRVTVDELDRLTGSFTYHEEGWTDSHSRYAVDLVVQLANVARLP